MAERSAYEPTLHERQVAVSMLAHAARRDSVAIEASLDAIADPIENLRATHVMAALIGEFQKGMDDFDSDDLALWFEGVAHSFAVKLSESRLA